MQHKAVCILSIVIIIFSVAASSSQWVKVNPFTTGSLTAFANGQNSGSIFRIMPVMGLAKASKAVPPTGRKETAKGRIQKSDTIS